jgi:hypothetical protein
MVHFMEAYSVGTRIDLTIIILTQNKCI